MAKSACAGVSAAAADAFWLGVEQLVRRGLDIGMAAIASKGCAVHASKTAVAAKTITAMRLGGTWPPSAPRRSSRLGRPHTARSEAREPFLSLRHPMKVAHSNAESRLSRINLA